MIEPLDRKELKIRPLADRDSKLEITEIAVLPEDDIEELSLHNAAQIARLASRIRAAHSTGRPVILTFGAHLIKNGLGPVLVDLINAGWITHVATNGAGSIHDWEFAYQGTSSEDVRENVRTGSFGIWDETGRLINMALVLGALDGLGYGWSIGKLISEERLVLPDSDMLRTSLREAIPSPEHLSALGPMADALDYINAHNLAQGTLDLPHPFKHLSVQYAAYMFGVPFTVHPGIGYDIIYTHPMTCGSAIGRAADLDFTLFAQSVSQLQGGVHISVGSSVMAPMIFEKAMSMANNLSIQNCGGPISEHYMAVVDIQDGGDWDWSRGEPPKDSPAYYLRFCKSFYRMGGTLDYIAMDNKAFMLGLSRAMSSSENSTG